LTALQWPCSRPAGREVDNDKAPPALDWHANGASMVCTIAFHRHGDHHADLEPGDAGVICSFGAGYSIGSVVARRV